MKTSCYLLILLAFIGTACASGGSAPTTSTPAKPVVHLDLSKYRPKFEVPAEATGSAIAAKPNIMPTSHINNTLHPTLDSLAETNKKILYTMGYRILVYSGNERKQAMDVRKMVTQRLPEVEEYFTYNQPTFRLKIGNYLSRLEARTDMSRLSDIAPNAMLMHEQVTINKP